MHPIGTKASASQNFLVPSLSEPSQSTRFKKSIESLPKNSSSDTEYSLQPYRVIKQSSNETNTSLTSSFNIDQPFGQELSLDPNDPNAIFIDPIATNTSPETTLPTNNNNLRGKLLLLEKKSLRII